MDHLVYQAVHRFQWLEMAPFRTHNGQDALSAL